MTGKIAESIYAIKSLAMQSLWNECPHSRIIAFSSSTGFLQTPQAKTRCLTEEV